MKTYEEGKKECEEFASKVETQRKREVEARMTAARERCPYKRAIHEMKKEGFSFKRVGIEVGRVAGSGAALSEAMYGKSTRPIAVVYKKKIITTIYGKLGYGYKVFLGEETTFEAKVHTAGRQIEAKYFAMKIAKEQVA